MALKVLRYGIPNERVPKSPLKQWVCKGKKVCVGGGVEYNQMRVRLTLEGPTNCNAATSHSVQ